MSRARAAVFASGTGSNFEAMMQAGDLNVDIVLLVCDKPEALVIEKAKNQGIQTFVFDAKAFDSKAAYETEIVAKLKEEQVDWIFLAGYMRIVGSTLLNAFKQKIVNIHPSYLPHFPGKDGIGDAFKAGVAETGVTIHFVDEGIDTGPIIAQEKVKIETNDTLDTLKAKIHRVEHELYPRVIKQLMREK